jgi:predicted Zn-ribbon and HTH transcriptional regulator
MGMVGVLLVKPLVLLGGAGYLAYRFLRNTVKSSQVGKEEREFTRSGGIEMTPCAKCGLYTQSDVARCPRCSESKEAPFRSG